ncbi:hypothetical protein [Sphingomonas rubra]|uniref:Uncharacterized protein n=1 Tax=Sphingomonas rubra TaxID=634430 RepID=A0A1I5RB90_9SPHN|nr:hypothetical protein [Sphingomonas rubra]SFP55607.1 hypothetical protein SAMN04488241_103127 [Sphingomonas rubra]
MADPDPDSGPDPDRSDQRLARRVIRVGFACLALAVLGMLALGIALLRS